jgi:hypothetical protein
VEVAGLAKSSMICNEPVVDGLAEDYNLTTRHDRPRRV